jgi:hypothetical protein
MSVPVHNPGKGVIGPIGCWPKVGEVVYKAHASRGVVFLLPALALFACLRSETSTLLIQNQGTVDLHLHVL